jgi:hypothetical protein
MMRRWIFHYEMSSAIVRLITFIVITWSISAWVNSRNGPEQPIRTWMINCFILLITDVIRLSIVSDPKYHGKTANVNVKDPNLFLKLTVMKVLIFPMSVATCLSVFAVLRQIDQLQYTTSQLMEGPVSLLDSQFELQSTTSAHQLSILVLIISSWSTASFERRQMLRKSALRLLSPHDEKISVQYRFVIGQTPSARDQLFKAPEILKESNQYHDLIMVQASDIKLDKSRKVFEALRWARSLDQHDYVIKSDDNVFVRWDIILDELAQLKQPQAYYWKGSTFRNIPVSSPLVDTSSLQIDYALPTLPAYTHSMFYLLSKYMLDLIVYPSSPTRRFVQGDGENIAIWLFGFHIEPIHDRRIQDATRVCENDLIAKRVAKLTDMSKMYFNIVNQRPQCTGFGATDCAVCYPCKDKKIGWRALNLACDQHGITLKEMSGFAQVAGKQPF